MCWILAVLFQLIDDVQFMICFFFELLALRIKSGHAMYFHTHVAFCLSQFAQEADAAAWTHRLHIYGLDFRDLGQLEAFCAFVCVHYERLDAIVNNGMLSVGYVCLIRGYICIMNACMLR